MTEAKPICIWAPLVMIHKKFNSLPEHSLCALSGNFPGCISESTTEEQVKELLDNVMDYDHEDSLAIASISSIASTRGEGASYLQGMEKLVDGMNGIPFNLVILASALSHKTISAIKTDMRIFIRN